MSENHLNSGASGGAVVFNYSVKGENFTVFRLYSAQNSCLPNDSHKPVRCQLQSANTENIRNGAEGGD